MAIAARQQNLDRRTVAVIGDGAMTAGMAFEAITHASHTGANMLVVLNDNQMSISKNTGGLNTYFSKIWASKTYNQLRSGGKNVLSHFPRPATAFVSRIEEYMKGMVSPATLFEELGFNYIGPIDGHDLDILLPTLHNLRELDGPQMLHIITTKGKGFSPAEEDPVGFHAISKIEPPSEDGTTATPEQKKPKQKKPKYQDIFGRWLCDEAAQDPRLVGITPAMCEGSGMVEFSERFADRFYDVAIAEQHAVTLAAGMACDGLKPVVAIYSTFLQRAYDQLIHDVALQNLDVTFGIDRAGLVGEDGPTHAGAFDLSYLRCIPNMLVMAPSDENECRQLLHTGYMHPGPAAIRYPRGTGTGVAIEENMQALPIGKGRICREGSGVAILNFGTLLAPALAAAESLNATVADMRFVKPLDTAIIDQLAGTHQLLVTIEENTVAGGAGSAVTEYLNSGQQDIPVLQLGLPDTFIDHGPHNELLAAAGLDEAGILRQIRTRMQALTATSGNRISSVN
jgi:1-deoxy-D-xylulose-5-phosphate synthase